MKKILVIVFMFCSLATFAQISINNSGNPPDTNAILDLQSNNKGILIPRIDLDSSTITNALGLTQKGMMVYNTNGNYDNGAGFYYWSGFKWLPLTNYSFANNIMDYDSNSYATVKINNKVWMAENLRTTHAPDGTLLDAISYWGNYDSDTLEEIYGRLYDWPTIMQNDSSSNSNPSGVQGICPDGWHLPSKAEFEELVNAVGGDSLGGGPLKEFGTYHWNLPNLGGSNLSGFNALPAGLVMHSPGTYYHGMYLGEYAYFWSCTANDTTNERFSIALYYDYKGVWEVYNYNALYFSVRCVKD